jgi:hypothetical protein
MIVKDIVLLMYCYLSGVIFSFWYQFCHEKSFIFRCTFLMRCGFLVRIPQPRLLFHFNNIQISVL